MTPRDDYYRSLIPLAPHDATCPSGGRWPTLFCCAPAEGYRAAHWPPPADPRTPPMMLNPYTTAERRKATALRVLRWVAAACFVALAYWMASQPNVQGEREYGRATLLVGFAVVAVLVVTRPWQRRRP